MYQSFLILYIDPAKKTYIYLSPHKKITFKGKYLTRYAYKWHITSKKLILQNDHTQFNLTLLCLSHMYMTSIYQDCP